VPSINTLKKYRIPQGDGIRTDNGYREGDQVPIYYDPMLAKLTVHGPSRKAAISKMLQAIQQYEVEGISTTLDFGAFVMRHPDFFSGHFDTNFVGKNWNKETIQEITKDDAMVAAWLVQHLLNETDQQLTPINY
jgi:propionyl-CoA carboxylase alpha chain